MSLFGILRMLPMFMSLWQNTTGEFMDLNTVLKRIIIENSNFKCFYIIVIIYLSCLNSLLRSKLRNFWNLNKSCSSLNRTSVATCFIYFWVVSNNQRGSLFNGISSVWNRAITRAIDRLNSGTYMSFWSIVGYFKFFIDIYPKTSILE